MIPDPKQWAGNISLTWHPSRTWWRPSWAYPSQARTRPTQISELYQALGSRNPTVCILLLYFLCAKSPENCAFYTSRRANLVSFWITCPLWCFPNSTMRYYYHTGTLYSHLIMLPDRASFPFSLLSYPLPPKGYASSLLISSYPGPLLSFIVPNWSSALNRILGP
jgi:hypothetical protein